MAFITEFNAAARQRSKKITASESPDVAVDRWLLLFVFYAGNGVRGNGVRKWGQGSGVGPLGFTE